MLEKKSYKHVVIIPTCAKPHIELKYLKLLKKSIDSTLFIFSINPVNQEQAKSLFKKIDAVHSYAELYYGKTFNVVKLWEEGPTSFGEACNKGYEYAINNCSDIESITFLNDDIDVTDHWQSKMFRCLNSDVFFTNTLIVEGKAGVRIEETGMKVGMVGPLSDNVGSEQQIKKPEQFTSDQFSNYLESKSINQNNEVANLFTSFLSGFCLMCNPEMLKEIYDSDGFIFDPIYKVGGFEDNDLMIRARLKNWIPLIDRSTFLHHDGSLTLSSEFQHSYNGMINQDVYLNKWKSFTQKKQKIIGAYRLAIFNINNLAQMGSSIRVNAKFLDGISILLTNNPAVSLQSYDKALFDRLRFEDQQFLTNCSKTNDPEELSSLLKEWVVFQSQNENIEINVECWDLNKSMNERDERNYNYQMATDMGADWIISIDSDECFEDRLKPEDIRRLSNVPDPLDSIFSFGWLNHYESMNVIRTDHPFCDGWRSGMNGVRMWRVWNNKHFPIVAGNEVGFHCGNAPEYGSYALKGTDIRFRHLSMVREIDRAAKTSFYNSTDNDKDTRMIGANNYNHIKRSQNVPITLYRKNNGIGMFTLAYDKEHPTYIAEKIRNYMGCSKHIIVWTSEWREEDRQWLEMNIDEFPTEEDWRSVFPTGPDRFIAVIARLYKVDFIFSSIDNGLAECRNSALNYYKENHNDTIGWALYLDPDEFPLGYHNTDVMACFRRMAEATDAMAFRFKFNNKTTLADGRSHDSFSESMRMIKLEKHLPIYFYGKAHETLEKSLNKIKSAGFSVMVEECPIVFLNSGLNLPPEMLANKLEKYQKLVVETLQDDPFSSAGWVNLGMTYEQDKDEANAEICYERACLTAGTAFLPFQSLALLYARKAVGLFYAASIRTKNVPSLHNHLNKTFTTLRELVGDFPVINTNGIKPSAKFKLPDFPYEKIVYDENNNQIVRRELLDDSNKD